MWKKDNSDWQKREGYVRYDYVVDSDVCNFCGTGFRKEHPCELKTFYNEMTKRNQTYCSGLYRHRPSLNLNLITLLDAKLHLRPKSQWIISLYPALIDDFDEFEEIMICATEGDDTARLFRKFVGCNYDPYLSLDVSAEEAKNMIASVPLFNDGDVPQEDELGLKLNILDGNKEEWLEKYQNKFKELRELMKQRAEVKERII